MIKILLYLYNSILHKFLQNNSPCYELPNRSPVSFLITRLKNPKIGGDRERRDHAGPREMSSPVRVGTYAPITSKITPMLFLLVRGIVQNLHVCFSPPPINTADETEHRAEQESGGREKSIRMNYGGRDVFLEEQQTRELSSKSSLISPDVSTGAWVD